MSHRTPELPPHSVSAEIIPSVSTDPPSPSEAIAQRGPRTIEMTKALRHEYEAVEDLTVHFRRFAKETAVGTSEDAKQRETLEMEATVLAAVVKQTVPTVTWNWLCKILADEHAQNEAKAAEDREKMRRYFGR